MKILRACLLSSVLLSMFFKGGAQNLVDNPGFEDVNITCTPTFGAQYINLVNWYNPDEADSCSTPDWFSTCLAASWPTHAPGSGQGNQNPRTGNAYAGFIAYDATTSSYREYLEGHLSDTLVAGQNYCVTFYVSLADNSPYAVNRIGMYLADTIVHFPVSHCISIMALPFMPQLQAPLVAQADKTNWVKLNWNYTANGGEHFFVIGNFYNNDSTTVTHVSGGNLSPFAYYFVDDVSVVHGTCTDLSVTASAVNTTSCHLCDGVATASSASGVGPVSYLWSDGNTYHIDSLLCAGNYSVTVTDSIGASVSAFVTVGQDSGLIVAATSDLIACGTGDGRAMAIVLAGITPFAYSWSNGSNTDTISGLSAGLYSVSVTSGNGCSTTASVNVDSSLGIVQQLCMVSVDSAGQYNIVVWEKADKYATDSFYIYSAIPPANTYHLIASIPRDSLSLYEDSTSEPGIYSYKYKMAFLDTCSHLSVLSNYHQTILLQNLGLGDLQWNSYEVEHNSSPVGYYEVYRDTSLYGQWELIASMSSTATNYNDLNYYQFVNVRYKIVAVLNISCNPTRSLNTSASNIISSVNSAIGNELQLSNIKCVYNGTNAKARLENVTIPSTIRLIDNLGRELQTTFNANSTTIIFDLSLYAPGMYFVAVHSAAGNTAFKVVRY